MTPDQTTLQWLIVAVLIPLTGILLRGLQALYERVLKRTEDQLDKANDSNKILTQALNDMKDGFKELTVEIRLLREAVAARGGD